MKTSYWVSCNYGVSAWLHGHFYKLVVKLALLHGVEFQTQNWSSSIYGWDRYVRNVEFEEMI